MAGVNSDLQIDVVEGKRDQDLIEDTFRLATLYVKNKQFLHKMDFSAKPGTTQISLEASPH